MTIDPTFGQMRQTSMGNWLESAGVFGPPGKHDDECEAKFVIEYAPGNPYWTECLCKERREDWLYTQPRIKVWKEMDREQQSYMMWRGMCRKCHDMWQFWLFGASLGYGLEHQRRCVHD